VAGQSATGGCVQLRAGGAATRRRLRRGAARGLRRPDTNRRVRRLRQSPNPRRAGGPLTLAFCWQLLEGRGHPARIAGSHRTAPPPGNSTTAREAPLPIAPPGTVVMPPSPARRVCVRRRRRKPANGAGRESRRAVARAPSIGCAGAPSLGRGQCRGPRKSSTTRCASSSAAKIGALEAIDALFGKG
jgi:hypothetical protein